MLDVADPYLPKEVGHFIPEPLNGHAARRATTSRSIPEGSST
jgi:hypothetical protein